MAGFLLHVSIVLHEEPIGDTMVTYQHSLQAGVLAPGDMVVT
jgi:hypothetical protein